MLGINISSASDSVTIHCKRYRQIPKRKSIANYLKMQTRSLSMARKTLFHLGEREEEEMKAPR